jgi:hypothetical protein
MRDQLAIAVGPFFFLRTFMSTIQVGYSSTDISGLYWPLEVIQTSAATGTQNDFTINTTTRLVVLSGAAPSITGLTGGRAGRVLQLHYTGSGTLSVTSQGAGSTAANRVITPTAGTVTVNPNQTLNLFYDNASSRWRVFDNHTLGSVAVDQSTGIVTLTNGQLKFPATQNASSDANTLDDYEEGTWTPTLVPTTGSGVTYTTQSGVYTKIGKSVWLGFSITLNSIGTGSGFTDLGGLPFPVAGGSIYDTTLGKWSFVSITACGLQGVPSSGTSTAQLYYLLSTDSGSAQHRVTAANMSAGFFCGGVLFYQSSS